MTLLRELATISSGDDSDEPSNRTFVTVQGTISFAHAPQADKYYQQMLSMPQFKKVLEEQVTQAFVSTISKFVSSSRVPVEQAAQNWRDDFEGQINITNTAIRGEHK